MSLADGRHGLWPSLFVAVIVEPHGRIGGSRICQRSTMASAWNSSL